MRPKSLWIFYASESKWQIQFLLKHRMCQWKTIIASDQTKKTQMRTMKAVSRIYSAAHLTVSICDSFHQICKKITIGRSIEIQQENDEWKKVTACIANRRTVSHVLYSDFWRNQKLFLLLLRSAASWKRTCCTKYNSAVFHRADDNK